MKFSYWTVLGLVLSLLIPCRSQPETDILQDLKVPDVSGLSLTEAYSIISESGFTNLPSVKHQDVDDSAIYGRVIEQNPRAGAKTNRDIQLVLRIATSQNTTHLPDLSGQSGDRAIEKLQRLGMQITFEYRVHSGEIPGVVLSQDPKNMNVKKGIPVRLTLSTQTSLRSVPDLFQLSLEQAKELLNSNNLVFLAMNAMAIESFRAIVTSQTPQPGSRVQAGSPIYVNLTEGDFFQIPDYRGKYITDVQNKLQQQNIKLKIEETRASDSPKGMILSQSPEPGRRILDETAPIFTFVVSNGERLPVMPELTDLSADERRDFFRRHNIEMNFVEIDTTLPSGTLLSQKPPADTPLNRGDVVTMMVARRRTATAQNFTGKQLAEVESLLAGGYRFRVIRLDTLLTAGRIFDQYPAPGDSIKTDTDIILYVAQPQGTFRMPDFISNSRDVISDLPDSIRMDTVYVKSKKTPGTIVKPVSYTHLRAHET